MKKSAKFLCVLFILLLVLPQAAVFAEAFRVYDEAFVLSDGQMEQLEEKYKTVSEKYNVDVALAITKELYGRTVMESADDFYDDGDYGMGENDDGILLYICMGTGEYHITTHGTALTAFNANGIRYIKEKIVPYLEKDEYYKAVDAFAEVCDELLKMYAEGKPYNEEAEKGVVVPVIIAVGVSLLFTFVSTSKKMSQMKTANKQTYASDYVKPGSVNIAFSRDIFLYSRTDRKEKPKSDDSSHTSSSGRTHGGGGGSF